VDAYAAANFWTRRVDNYVSAPGLSRFQRQYTSGYLSDVTRNAGPHQRFICAEQNAYVPPNADPEGCVFRPIAIWRTAATAALF